MGASERRLAGKAAVVVGAGQIPEATIGNGRATALRFAQEGTHVLLADRHYASVKETREMVLEGGGWAGLAKSPEGR